MRKFLLVFLVLVILGVIGLGGYIYLGPKFNSENRQIDKWISENNLNKYGDSQSTGYSNGNPVDSILPSDRYEYIKKTHTDKPWAK